MPSTPRVSVILSAYNSGPQLSITIESILNQSFSDFELLIMDDRSIDATPEILSHYCQKDPRITVITNDLNMGMGYCFQRLVALSRGTYIAQIGHDDIWRARYLELLVKDLDAKPEAVAAFCEVEILNTEGGTAPTLFKGNRIPTLSRHALFSQLFEGNFLCASGGIMRRTSLPAANSACRTDYFQDWMCWLGLAMQGEFMFNPECLVQYRIHHGNLSLNIKSYRQFSSELNSIRLGIIAQRAWADWVLRAPDPESFFKQIVNVYVGSIEHAKNGDLQLLHFVLRRSELKLLNLAAYREALALLLWSRGNFTESTRYARFRDIAQRWPNFARFWKKALVLQVDASRRRISLCRVDVPREKLPSFLVIFLRPARSLELMLEKLLNFNERKIRYLLDIFLS